MKIIAHRGSSYLAPENTLGAIRLAWEEGAEAVEIDVRLTRDRRIVAVHDHTMQRTGRKRWIVARHTLQQLKMLDVGRWKGEAWCGEAVPTLEEALHATPRGRRLWIEVKAGRKVVPELLRVLGEAPQGRAAVISFSLKVLVAVKHRMPEIKVYWVRSWPRLDTRKSHRLRHLKSWIEKCRKTGVDGLNVKFHRGIDAAMIALVHQGGLCAFVWTVNSADEARKLAALGVDGVTTDRPGWLREQLAEPKETKELKG